MSAVLFALCWFVSLGNGQGKLEICPRDREVQWYERQRTFKGEAAAVGAGWVDVTGNYSFPKVKAKKAK